MLPEDQHEEIGDKAENVGQGKGKAAHVDLGVPNVADIMEKS